LLLVNNTELSLLRQIFRRRRRMMSTNKVTTDRKNSKAVVAKDPVGEPGRLARIGGSQSDD